MDTNRHYHYNVEADSHDEATDEMISIDQLQHLVQLLNRSDVSEIEVTRPGEGTRLVLRKAVESHENGNYQVVPQLTGSDEAVSSSETRHTVFAPLVGIFHTWVKPKGKALVAVGDRVKVGQVICSIQSLNVINEVETPVAGRIIEILVQDGQPVEYGQQLIIIDGAEEV